MMGQINPEQWRRVFSKNLPGEKAQLLMAPEFREVYEHDSDPVPAAVMVLMYPFHGEIHLVFMKRNAYDGPHSAQVSFPGGAWEHSDESFLHTALRETKEELGISGKIEVLGSLTPLHIPVSNFLVTPYVGWMAERPAFSPDSSEVQYVIETSLKALLDPDNILTDTWHQHGRSIRAAYYSVGNEKIWGATAMMLCEFLQLAARMR